MKNKKYVVGTITILALLSMVIVTMVDYFINKQITFSKLVNISIPFVYIIVMSFILSPKRKILASLLSLSLFSIPYLFLLEKILLGSWFTPLGLPIGIIAIVSLWISFCLFLFKGKIGNLRISALLVFQYGVLVNGIIKYVIARYIQEPFLSVSLAVNTISSTVITVLLFLLAVRKPVRVGEKIEVEEIEIDEKEMHLGEPPADQAPIRRAATVGEIDILPKPMAVDDTDAPSEK